MSDTPAARPVQPSLPELLEHATFLRRLAARLAGPDNADDLLQEAYTTALTRPPNRASLRGWLAIVVTNLARRERRTAARRIAREGQAARAEREDDSTLALERLDLQRALSELVVALPEEQRTVLYLRYFEGLMPSAIATRLGVPLKTIESRHTRALASLRAKLDERSGGDRAAWVAVLAPWADGAGVGFVVALAVAGVFLCGGAWLAWRGFVAGSSESAAEASVVATARPATPPETRAPRREAIESAPVASVGAVGRLAGVALALDDRQPLVGLTLRLTLGDGKADLTTDEHGRFRYETDVPRRLVQLELAAGPRTIPLERKLGQRLEPGETIELELLAPSGATLAGRVVDENDSPVSGATVIGHCVEQVYGERRPERTATTGPEGSFVIEHLGESFRLTAEALGMACLEGVRGKVASGTRGEGLVLRIAPAQLFRGEVVDEDGRPIAGVELTAGGFTRTFSGDGTAVLGVRRFDAERLSGKTDGAGRFELKPSPHLHSRVNLRANWKGGFIDQHADVRGDEWNRLVLDTGLELTGVVKSLAGEPLAGALVKVTDTAQGRSTSDEQGRFTIGGLMEAPSAIVIALAPGHAMEVVEPVRVEEGMRPIELRLGPEFVIAGRIVDESGHPFADARLRLEGDRLVEYDSAEHGVRETWEWAADRNETRTDEQGRFRFEQLYEGTFDLHVTPGEGPPVGLPFRVRSGEQALELVVMQAQRLGVLFSGRVLDAITGNALTSFQVTLSRPSGEPERRTEEGPDGITIETSVFQSWHGKVTPVTNDNGDYLLAGNTPGFATLSFDATGYIPAKLEPREYALGEHHEDVRLMPARSVQFVLDGGAKVGDARLRFRDASGTRVSIGTSQGSWSDAISIRKDHPTAAELPRIPLQVTASAFDRTDVEFQLEAEREGLDLVVIHFPEEERRSIWLVVYESEDASLTTGELDFETLRQALLDGVITPPRDPVAFEFVGESGKLHCRAQLTPLGDGKYKEVVWYSDSGSASWSESQGDASLRLYPPETVRRATVVSPGCRPLTLDLDQLGPWPERPEFRIVVLERVD